MEKPLEWIGSTWKDLRACPDNVKDVFGYALHLAQHGERHLDAFPMKGHLRGVMEVVADTEGGTYRAMYTVKFASVVYVLNVFQKKSTRGIKTPQRDIELVEKRLNYARVHYEKHYR